MERISIKENPSFAIKKMREAIEQGKVIIYPTDTLYGIGGNALDEKIVKKIYKIKKRSKHDPLSVIIKDIGMIKEYCNIKNGEKRKLKKYLPGPYTVLVKRSRKKIPVSNIKRLGIRMPAYSFIKRVMEKVDVPLISTSANISGEESPTSLDQIPKEILDMVDFVFDGGETKLKRPSTIVDLPTGRVLRDFSKKS